MSKGRRIAHLVFLIAGALTVLEFCFVRGMFTWLLAVAAAILTGAVNLALACRDRDWPAAAHYILTTVALCMGYLILA